MRPVTDSRLASPPTIEDPAMGLHHLHVWGTVGWGAVGFMGEHFWDANLGLCVAQVFGAVWTGGTQGRNSP